MFIVDVILRIARRAGDLARELLIQPELPAAPSQEDVDRAVEGMIEKMLAGPEYPRLQAWLGGNEPTIETEIIGVFRVQ